MKVLLLKDVRGSGAANQIVEVSDGYARNYLIPRGLATPADAQNINSANLKREAAKHRVDLQRKAAAALADNISGLTVKVVAKSGENGRLFGSVTAKEIAVALKEQYGIEVDKKKISLAEPIRELGIVEVSAHMYEQTDAKFKVEVIAQ